MPQATFHFPKGFCWGGATAAHQVEGNNSNNDWWVWEQEGHIRDGQTSGLACDWWNNAERDFDLAAQLNNNAHRLSVEWSRIEPAEGKWDSAAIDRYRAMLQGLRQRGIEPMVTLHHFSTPLWLAERGGWENSTIVPLFERFAEKVARSLGDLCDFWCTINEPTIYALLGWVAGAPADAHHHQLTFPPGKHEPDLAMAVIENMLVGHAAAYHAVHRVQPAARVGIVHNMTDIQPANPNSPLDRFVSGQRDRIVNQSVLDAVFHGKIVRFVGSKRSRQLKGTTDFFGLNYYTRNILAFDRRNPDALFSQQVFPQGAPMSDGMYGEIYPDGLYHLLKRLGKYNIPIYITENGLPDADDDQRPAYLVTHLRQIWWAIQCNIPVMGYYHWSLVDNFEWAEGWNLRFGLIKVNPQTQERNVRKSGRLFAEIAGANAITTDMVSRYAPELMEKLFPG